MGSARLLLMRCKNDELRMRNEKDLSLWPKAGSPFATAPLSCGHGSLLRILFCAAFFILHASLFTPQAHAQLNTDRLITIGRSALYYEDYVVSIQYFNQAITAKPYLYEPWFLRGVAKYNLDDFAGAERDCTEAIERNPYVVNVYELRGLARIQQQNFSGAIGDYNRALRYDPMNRSLWHNRVLCHIQNKEYDLALSELDTIQARWSSYAQAWSMRADIYMQQQDTTRAIVALQQSLDIDPYDGHTWAARSIISLSREEWKDAEHQLDQAIHLIPKNGDYHINRALARYNQNNLRGAMDDYDMALDLEPNNFLGHYNRGLLRTQVGDDNRAISDFDFVLRLEPDNMLALFNRGVLLERTGDYRGAVSDYTKVINEYPDFWTGIEYRARCYRRLGMTAKAELDEFAVYKARLYKHLYGTDSKKNKRGQRKRSDRDPDKYNQLVVEDELEPEREYDSEYRGKVQNRRVEIDFMPMFALSPEPPEPTLNTHRPYDPLVEQQNERSETRPIFVSNAHISLSSTLSANYFDYIDSLSSAVDRAATVPLATRLVMARAIVRSCLQDNEGAIEDLATCLSIDSTLTLALWQRAVCQAKASQFQWAEGKDVALRQASAMSDMNHALALSPNNPYLLYNRGCLYAMQQQYDLAIADFTATLEADPRLAEAYYNRAICLLRTERAAEAVSDLSKAGELGIYDAYSIIKKYRPKASSSLGKE